ncbi:Translation initiation factor eIF-2B subunit beta [Histomonas meleagridis]|uniref:Translation initiation factor eIF-2B subunit beta n=1 Tax=Histomonas meleagridis TaxID=135588 RepID=UPI00355A0682|nr:Translation initiation factor eIF-2B subunit beta [Histomonas meleagridis]KAH0804040.1 Translation initiation factor eIF-2B subunit beta [Histomonas meleagridis]
MSNKIIAAVDSKLRKFELDIRRRVIYGSHQTAESACLLIKKSIQNAKTDEDVKYVIQYIINQLQKHLSNNIVIRNLCADISRNLNEEWLASRPENREIVRSTSRSVLDMFVTTNDYEDIEPPASALKTRMEEILNSTIDELSSTYEAIARHSPNFISSNDIILTVGVSTSILKFLSDSKCKKTVIIPEHAPQYDGNEMAKKLRDCGIKVIVIPDSAIFAIIPKVSKIIVSAKAVLLNGGIVSYSITKSIALAAKYYSKPFIALYWNSKLSNEFSKPGKTFTNLLQPDQVLPYTDAEITDTVVINVESDYLPPELITMLISENGPHCPPNVFSYVQKHFFDE